MRDSRVDGVQPDLGKSIAGHDTTRDVEAEFLTDESPADWPRDVQFTVHASIGLIAGKCNVIRHPSATPVTRSSVARQEGPALGSYPSAWGRSGRTRIHLDASAGEPVEEVPPSGSQPTAP